MPPSMNPARGNVLGAYSLKKRGAFTVNQGRYAYSPGATGLGSESDAVTRALNEYLGAGGRQQITRVYSASSRVMRGTQDLAAVKFKEITGEEVTGWIASDGRLISEDQILSALHGLDKAAGYDDLMEGSLVRQYLEGSPLQQARMADALKELDWNQLFHDTLYKDEDKFWKADEDTTEQVHANVADMMEQAMTLRGNIPQNVYVGRLRDITAAYR